MNSSQQGYVKSDTDNLITTITFFHPAHNSLPGYLLKALTSAIQEASDSDQTQLIILQSGGDRTFCAGASFDELIAIENEITGKEFFMGFARVINACRTSKKLIIGRVQGKAVGGGVGLAAATDYCLATKYAAIKLSELAVGIGPFVVGPAVERKLGLSAFSQLTMDARHWRNAYWARDNGLFASVHDTAEDMDKAIDELSQQLIQSNPAALTALKEVFWHGTDAWDLLLEQRAEISGRLVLSPFSKQAIAQFKSKA